MWEWLLKSHVTCLQRAKNQRKSPTSKLWIFAETWDVIKNWGVEFSSLEISSLTVLTLRTPETPETWSLRWEEGGKEVKIKRSIYLRFVSVKEKRPLHHVMPSPDNVLPITWSSHVRGWGFLGSGSCLPPPKTSCSFREICYMMNNTSYSLVM